MKHVRVRMSLSLFPLNLSAQNSNLEDSNRWFLIRLDLCNNNVVGVRENFVIRKGLDLMFNHRPLAINATVYFLYEGAAAFGTVIDKSDDRKFLETELRLLETEMARQAAEPPAPNSSSTPAGPSRRISDEEEEDYSSSHSDWAPSEQTSSEEEEQYQPKKMKLESRHSDHNGRQKNRLPNRMPSLKADAIISKTSVPSQNVSWTYQSSAERFSHRMRQNLEQRNSLPVRKAEHPRRPESGIHSFQENHSTSNENVMAALSMMQSTVNKLVQELSEMKRELGFQMSSSPSPSSGFSEHRASREKLQNWRKRASRDELLKREQISQRTPYAEVSPFFHNGHAQEETQTHSAEGEVYDFVDEESNRQRQQHKKSRKSKKAIRQSSFSTSQLNGSEDMRRSSHSSNDPQNYADMVPIGIGNTLIPRHVLNSIDWNSYTMATRKLLMAVFPRRILATHSLTGKPSPAFANNKPAKLALDTARVTDIIMTVVEKCRVKEGLVRGAITTKCADENKMYRMRQQKKEKNRKPSPDQENKPPKPEKAAEQPFQKSPEPGCSTYAQV